MTYFRPEQRIEHDATEAECHQLMRLAMGRIFLLGSRPFQEGDLEQYEAARAVMRAAHERLETIRGPHGRFS